jgi:ribonucleoside-diphosphate reductase alpha chain
MYRSLNLAEDLALKQVVTDRFNLPLNERSFAWREALPNETRSPISDILVTKGTTESHFSLADVADAIGNSLTDLLIAREQEEATIFTDANRKFVADVAHSVAAALTRTLEEGNRLRLSEADLYLLIEKALLENDAYDVAKSLAFRSRKTAASTSTPARKRFRSV